MQESLGQRIRRARVRYGITQAELARRIGVSTNTMNNIEMGETPDPRASRIKAIAEVLGVTTDALLHPQTVDPPPKEHYYETHLVPRTMLVDVEDW